MKTFAAWRCIKEGSLVLFDKITSGDVIPLTDDIRLVRYQGNSTKRSDSSTKLK